MQSRLFTLLGLLALFAVFTSNTHVNAQNSVNTDGRANPAVLAVTKIIGSQFAGAAAGCLAQAAGQCARHWRNPRAAMSCGKNFLKTNKGRCATG